MRKKNVCPATLLCDFYKISHKAQYPVGTEYVYSTWIPRDSRIDGVDKVVAFGFQAFIDEFLIDYFNDNFFSRSKEEVVAEYRRVLIYALGDKNPDSSHIEELHDLQYLPIRIKAVEEGALVPLRVPMLTVENTHPKFFWITNYIETLMSCQLWMTSTSATIALEYRKLLDSYAMETVGNTDFVGFQGHDFSMRGMGSLESSKLSGAGHLLSFFGTDTIPAIVFHESYYNANIETELVGTSIPATEHSVMCAYGRDELASYKRIITEVYPAGFVSIVSDTWDLWTVLTEVISKLKEEIMNRDGKVVIRPDSGDPVDIICGNPNSDNELERKGVVEVLWDVFGGTVSDQGYKILDSHIGCIYGDAITVDRCRRICEGLKAKGFASINTVYGIGSFTYQYNTRDTFGFALKSTHVVINGEEQNIYKDPATDKDKIKKSLTGRVCVVDQDGLKAIDGLTIEQQNNVKDDLLLTIFEDGNLLKETSLSQIRKRLTTN
jgi:nicotinamide phosphoribosyltransferase